MPGIFGYSTETYMCVYIKGSRRAGVNINSTFNVNAMIVHCNDRIYPA